MGRYLEIAKRAIKQLEQSRPSVELETVQTQLPVSDPYAERMQAALREINRPYYAAGMILWLDTAHPDLYGELTSRLPDEIHRLWEAHAPLEEFEQALERLVAAHKRAVALYGRHRAATGSKGGP